MFSRKTSHQVVAPVTTSSSSNASSFTSNGGTSTVPPTPSTLSTPGTPTGPQDYQFTPGELSASPPSGSYSRSNALDDLPFVRRVLHLFLGGKMLEAEKLCRESDPNAERLYTASGLGIIQALKGLMSFEEADIASALEVVKHAALIAGQHRRPASSLGARLAGMVVGGNASGVGFIKGMTPVERHAELVYSECLLEKAILGIVSSGDWLTFIREFINIRSATNVYRTLGDFIKAADAEAVARGEGPEDKSIDSDFRSGVALGLGVNSLCLSLLPDSVSHVVALFGYKGDRMEAVATLSQPGGWNDSKSGEPVITWEHEGLRRPCTDLVLTIFHLFISSIAYTGVNISQARNIVQYNLTVYPEGVFFLFLKGRLHVLESRPEMAIDFYRRGMELTEYKSLKGVAEWEIGLCCLTLCDFAGATPYLRAQEADSNWSKAVYAYCLAVCLYETGHKEEAIKYFAKVHTVVRRIAGKSIPGEKYAVRKARKFEMQKSRLLHPGMETCYIFGTIQHTPRKIFLAKQIPALQATLDNLATHANAPSKYEGGHGGYWDDCALARLLHGVCMRYVAYPHLEAIETPEEAREVEAQSGGKEATTAKALESLKWVIEHGPKIELDHQLVYCAHLELGKLYACMGKMDDARRELELVASGKPLEVNAAGKKGSKYSMQNAVQVKTHSALEALESGHRL